MSDINISGKVKLSEVSLKVQNILNSEKAEDFTYIEIGAINPNSNKIDSYEKVKWQNASPNAKQKVFKDDVLCSTVRVNLRKIALVDKDLDDGIATVGFCVIRANKEFVFPKFLFYECLTEGFNEKLLLFSGGTTYPIVKNKDVLNIEIPLPSLEEQQQIADLFQSLDFLIEQTEEQKSNLLNLKNHLLRNLFGEKQQFGNYLNEDDFEKVKFEQIAFNISERVEPQETDYTIYVGLEHLDPDNLKIERKGKPEDVIGTKLKIYEGDIIFGKRRAYQRKVAVADFEGICSAHSMVLRTNEKAIEKDLLPFFMQSDAFMNRAVQISEGSLSPTIKWKVLANQEFVLPKREKQKQLAEIFIHFDKVIGEIRQQKQTLKNLKFKLLNEILG
jgi:type I restriction enzyme S subunit